MKKHNFLIAIVIACVLIFSALWLENRQPVSTGTSSGLTTTTNDAANAESDDTSASTTLFRQASPLNDDTSNELNNDEITTDANLNQPGENTELNPFTVDDARLIESPGSPIADATVQASKPEEKLLPAKLVVPSSYVVEDAATYFLPKSQRRVGNLGGPPPVPNAASVPGTRANVPESPTFMPPPAPGQ